MAPFKTGFQEIRALRLNGKKWTFRSRSGLHKVILIHCKWPFGTMDNFTMFYQCPCLQLTRHRNFMVARCNRKMSWAEKRQYSKMIFAKDSLILDHRLWKHGNKWLFTILFVLFWNFCIFWSFELYCKKEFLHSHGVNYFKARHSRR